MTGPLPGYITYKLREFLGDDLNTQLMWVGDDYPDRPPGNAADILPIRIPLSGGEIYNIAVK